VELAALGEFVGRVKVARVLDQQKMPGKRAA
jgi:hypothetical protein